MSFEGWKNSYLREIVILNYGKSLTADKRIQGRVPVYSSAGITGWHNAALVQENGLIIGRKGVVGSVFYSDKPFYCIDTAYFIKESESKCDIKFLYYLLKTLGLEKLNEDSAVPGLNREYAYSQNFQIPESTETQKRIADILSALDEKIELNRQTNVTLENIAQTIFKEWFVNFNYPLSAPGFEGLQDYHDYAAALKQGTQLNQGNHTNQENHPRESTPPNTKNQGNHVNQENHGADMVESELGPIPKGWRVGTFEDELLAERGLSYKGSGLETENAVPMHNLNSILEGGGYKIAGIKYYSGEYREKHISKPGDLIIANTEQGHKYLLIGYPAIIPSLYGELGIYSHHIYRLQPKPHSYLTSDFLFQLLLLSSIREQVVGFANGTTVNMLKIEGLQKPKFILPPQELVVKFSELAMNFRIRQEENIKESRTLATIRDTLLPKLMSGEINV